MLPAVTFMNSIRLSLALSCAALGAVAIAAEPQAGGDSARDETQAVFVSAMRDPVNKSYRKMIKGMDLFERLHGIAPEATLRYKLLPRQHGTRMDGIAVEIVANTITLPVTVAADRTFTLERDPTALEEDAAVMPNRKASSLTWRTEIRTPGLPANTRRLGDLRLECQVGMEAGLVSNTRPVIGLITNLIQGMMDFCGGGDTPYLFFAERPLFSVTLVAGVRRLILSIDDLYAGIGHGRISRADLEYCDCQVLLDRTYFLPLGDRSWPDETRVEFDYMDDSIDNSMDNRSMDDRFMDDGMDRRTAAAPPVAQSPGAAR